MEQREGEFQIASGDGGLVFDVIQYATLVPYTSGRQERTAKGSHRWALRDGTLRHLDVIPDGIITFPSYHTAVALICGWATWRIRWIGPLNAVFAGLVILTTLPIGGHHLMDLIGGAAVVAASLKVARAVEQRVPSEAHAVHTPAAGEDWSWIKASSRRKAKLA